MQVAVTRFVARLYIIFFITAIWLLFAGSGAGEERISIAEKY